MVKSCAVSSTACRAVGASPAVAATAHGVGRGGANAKRQAKRAPHGASAHHLCFLGADRACRFAFALPFSTLHAASSPLAPETGTRGAKAAVRHLIALRLRGTG